MQSSLDAILVGAALPERIAARVQVLLASSPDPASALHFLERLRQESPGGFDRVSQLAGRPALRGASLLVQRVSLRVRAADSRTDPRSGQLRQPLPRAFGGGVRERLFEFLGAKKSEGVPPAVDLARFRRRQLLRIVLRDVLGVATLSDVTQELSHLADAILDVAYRRLRAEFVARHGEPRLPDGRPCGFSVISLGKLGGEELNYSSDIDLMFVYGGNGETDGPSPISNKEFYKKVANEYTSLLSSYTADGQCYRVDLRLRPDGTLGEICISAEGAQDLLPRSRPRLGKADADQGAGLGGRARAGSGAAGIRRAADLPELAGFPRGGSRYRKRASASARRWRRNGGCSTGLDVKLSPGGIRDIEFLVQCLQRLHGGREPWIRHGGTMLALFRLRDKGLLSDGEYARLASAYQFLRYRGAPPANGRGPADPQASRGSGAARRAGAQTPAGKPGDHARPRRRSRTSWRSTWRACARLTSG